MEAAAARLGTDDEAGARRRVVEALRALDEHLLAHPAFEEDSIAPTLLELIVPPWMVPSQ